MQKDSMSRVIEHFIDAFESQIQRIEAVFNSSEAVSNSSSLLAEDFQVVLKNLREELTHANDLLRNSLAKNGSVRKSDYNNLMDEIFVMLNKKEKDAKDSFYRYIEDQKSMVHMLRSGILSVKNTEAERNKQKIEDFKKELDLILKKQQSMKEFVMSKFQDYQNAHNSIIKRLMIAQENTEYDVFMSIRTIKEFLLKDIS